MKTTMIIPSYWGRKKVEGWKEIDAVYDHPTPLDEEGTLARILSSLSILRQQDFNLVVIGVATAPDIQEEVEAKISSIIKEVRSNVPIFFFSHSHLAKVHQYLKKKNQKRFIPMLKLRGYSNVRNLCLFLAHLFGSEAAVLIDDDEIFEDPLFMDKALQHVGRFWQKERVLAVAGYYINPDDNFLLKKKISPWMTYWNTVETMNRAFQKIIVEGPRLKITPFAFGGNMVIHRHLYTLIPFDPFITRGEDIDFLINARLFGYKIYLDNKLAIKHAAPPKSQPLWRQLREDVFRFIYEKSKLEAQQPSLGLQKVRPEDLDPYPGEFLKEDLNEKIYRSHLMLAVDYLSQGDKQGAIECMKNIYLAETKAKPRVNLLDHLIKLQKNWQELMAFFASEKEGANVCKLLGYLK